ncbi:MAG: NAD(P)H-binding protein [Actinomycetota bacterium]
MTVLVTGASGLVGRALVSMLAERDEVRACVRDPRASNPLQALGAKVTLGRLDDAAALSEVCGGVFTMFHLVGGLQQPDDHEVFHANHGSVMVALEAAKTAGVRRFVLVSAAGADSASPNAYLRAKGFAEEAVVHSGLEFAVVRSAHAYGLGGLWFASVVQGAASQPPLVLGDGRQEVAPVFVDDLARVLVAIDDAKDLSSGVYGLEGPDVLSADGLAAALRGDDAAPEHALGDAAVERLSELLEVPVTPAAADLFQRPSRVPETQEIPSATSVFATARSPLVDGVRQTLDRAALPGTG